MRAEQYAEGEQAIVNRAHRQRWRNSQLEERTQQFVKGCEGKKRHPSKRVALGVKHAMLAVSKSYDEWERLEVNLEAYKCECCGRWHLGNR